jgi:S-methylmethionine-dependent homocysteine/selenocysteine methylase
MNPNALPQLDGRLWLADGGLETTLVFIHGVDLPDFAAFPLLANEEGRLELRRYYDPYLQAAVARNAGFVLDTPTWRASRDWGDRLGWDAGRLAELNTESVAFVRGLAEEYGVEAVVNGVIGPRGDGYVVGAAMSDVEAAEFHALQAKAFAEGGADMITAVTMTYAGEAIGITRAAAAVGLPVAISFTVETDGRLPSGQDLGDAITEVDHATDGYPSYFMVNCAHPTHFAEVLASGDGWQSRIRGIRANASRASHAELDEAEVLDRGNPQELASNYASLAAVMPQLAVVGGCCGTDQEHIEAIARALTSD